MMRRQSHGALFMFLTAVLVSFTIPLLSLGAEGGLVFSPSHWAFGTIPDTRPVTMEVSVQNLSDQEVEVSFIPLCECLTVVPQRMSLQPVGTGTTNTGSFGLTFDPKGYRGEVALDYVVRTTLTGLEKGLFSVHGTVTAGGATAAATGQQGQSDELPKEGKRTSGEPIVLYRYYYSPGCQSCERFLAAEVPAIERELGIVVDVLKSNIFDDTAYERYQSLLRLLREKERAYPALLVGRTLLQGEGEIRRRVRAETERALREGTARFDPFGEGGFTEGAGAGKRLALVPVLAAGLLDGVNPCAFTTLIFLISALAVAGRSRREVLFIGLFFTASVFGTYYAIGLGAFGALRVASGFPVIAAVIRWLLVTVLILFAGLSIYDYVIIKRGAPTKILLQLPSGVKRRLHGSIKAQARSAALVTSSVVMGFLVSVFELACTGQVYLPTITYMVRNPGAGSAYFYLLLYNLAFILPLVVVFVVSLFGLSSRKLGEFMQRSMGKVKLGLAALFISLAILTIIT